MAQSIFLTSAVLVLGALAAFHAVTHTATFVAQPRQALAAKPQPDWARVATTAGTGALLALVEQQQAIAAGKSDYDDRQELPPQPGRVHFWHWWSSNRPLQQ